MIAPAGMEAEIRRERQSFIVLQHLHTITDADTARAVSVWRAGLELGFTSAEIDALVRHLVEAEYLALARGGNALCVTPAGADYIERLAGRRSSVRLPAKR